MSNKEEHHGVNEQDTIAYSYPHPRREDVVLIVTPNSKFIELNNLRNFVARDSVVIYHELIKQQQERELLQLGREEE